MADNAAHFYFNIFLKNNGRNKIILNKSADHNSDGVVNTHVYFIVHYFGMERSYVNYYSVRSLHNDAIEMRLNFCSLIVNYIIFFHDTRPLPSSFAKT